MSVKKKFKQLDPVDQKRKLGARIKQLRIERGFTSAETFANTHQFQRSTYGKYEQGKETLNIEFETLIKLANAFGVTLSEFFNKDFEEG